jgi:Transposase IS200 like
VSGGDGWCNKMVLQRRRRAGSGLKAGSGAEGAGVYQTLRREPVLPESLRPQLYAYAAGVLRDLDSPATAISGCRDHLHVLFSLSKNQPLSRVVMEVKRATSKMGQD